MRQNQLPRRGKATTGLENNNPSPTLKRLTLPPKSSPQGPVVSKNTAVNGVAPTRLSSIQEGPTENVTESLIKSAGGIFIGEQHLLKLGIIKPGTTVPPIPPIWSLKFLNATNPLRREAVAKQIIFGYDPESQKWHCFEKSIIPGSLGREDRGMTGMEQDRLLFDSAHRPRMIEGLWYTSPSDHRPIVRVLNNAIKILLQEGKRPKELPFFNEWGRTADVKNADAHCRVLIGYPCREGVLVSKGCRASNAHYGRLGLLGSFEVPPERK
jgi:hypothetical protein